MMRNVGLTEQNFVLFCAKVYDNPGIERTEEFTEDLDRIKYIKKLLTRYGESGILKDRLILNHIITLHNCFGEHLAKILYLKMEKQFHLVKPFLVLLNALPSAIYNVGNHKVVYTDDVAMDPNIITALRSLTNAYSEGD